MFSRLRQRAVLPFLPELGASYFRKMNLNLTMVPSIFLELKLDIPMFCVTATERGHRLEHSPVSSTWLLTS